MAFLSAKEFAIRAGTTPNNIGTYELRGKIFKAANGLYDDTDPRNVAWLDKRLRKKEVAAAMGSEEAPAVESKPSPEGGNDQPARGRGRPKAPKKKAKRLRMTAEEKTKRAERDEDVSITREKNKIELEKKRKELHLQELQLAKKQGQLMPTDLAQATIKQFSKDIITGFYQSIDNLLTEIGKKRRMERDEMAELRTIMRKLLNEGVDKAVDLSQKSVINIAGAYSEKLDTWEREA
jgi:hypothetical protein